MIKEVKKIKFITLIIIAGIAVYSNSLNNKFIWDDELLIKHNTYIRNWSNISKLFTQNIGAGAGREYMSYRPLQMLTYMMDYSLCRLNPTGYHITNILLHIFVALAIYWLINILYHNSLLSLFTSILFVVHPIHTEAVTYISGRADSLSVLFMLLSLIFYIEHPSMSYQRKASLICILSYILALLSKEIALVVPLLLLLYHYTFKKEVRIRQFLPILAITFIYAWLRLTVLKFSQPHEYTTLFQRMPGFFVALTNYLRLIILPFNLHMEYGLKLFKFGNPQAILGVVILFSSVLYAFRKRRSEALFGILGEASAPLNRLIFFAVLWFYISLFPVSNIYPINAYMAEHWLYLPSLGFFLILAKLLNSIHRVRFPVAMGLLAFYSCLTIRQNNYWKEPIPFYRRTLKYVPDSPRAYYNLGNAYKDKGMNEEAIKSYKKSIKINPTHPDIYNVYNNLGVAYYNQGKIKDAIESFRKAIAINPKDISAYNNLGNVYMGIGKIEGAIELYKKAIEINPNYAVAYNNLAVLYFYEKQYKLAIKYCDKAQRLGYKVSPNFLKILEPYR